jgi:hypothetical protein
VPRDRLSPATCCPKKHAKTGSSGNPPRVQIRLCGSLSSTSAPRSTANRAPNRGLRFATTLSPPPHFVEVFLDSRAALISSLSTERITSPSVGIGSAHRHSPSTRIQHPSFAAPGRAENVGVAQAQKRKSLHNAFLLPTIVNTKHIINTELPCAWSFIIQLVLQMGFVMYAPTLAPKPKQHCCIRLPHFTVVGQLTSSSWIM